MNRKCFRNYSDEADGLQKLEFDIEDRIYKMLRTEFVITNNRYVAPTLHLTRDILTTIFLTAPYRCFPFHAINDTFMSTMILILDLIL